MNEKIEKLKKQQEEIQRQIQIEELEYQKELIQKKINDSSISSTSNIPSQNKKGNLSSESIRPLPTISDTKQSSDSSVISEGVARSDIYGRIEPKIDTFSPKKATTDTGSKKPLRDINHDILEVYKGRTISLDKEGYKINDVIQRFQSIDSAKQHIDSLSDSKPYTQPSSENKESKSTLWIFSIGLIFLIFGLSALNERKNNQVSTQETFNTKIQKNAFINYCQTLGPISQIKPFYGQTKIESLCNCGYKETLNNVSSNEMEIGLSPGSSSVAPEVIKFSEVSQLAIAECLKNLELPSNLKESAAIASELMINNLEIQRAQRRNK